jgi:hypothetical protein
MFARIGHTGDKVEIAARSANQLCQPREKKKEATCAIEIMQGDEHLT